MLRRFPLLVLILIVVLALFSSGCPKKTLETEPAPPPPPPPAEEPAPVMEPPKEVEPDFPTEPPTEIKPPMPTMEEINESFQTIYFDFDKYDLDDQDRARLQQNARVLQEHPSYDLVIEGHCDERGTIEYNLALGERRANSVRDYLGSLGVDAGRIRILSFGEERPAAPGSNEGAWAQNRRAEFKFEG